MGELSGDREIGGKRRWVGRFPLAREGKGFLPSDNFATFVELFP